MRGLVLKNHYEPTASLAYIVRKEVPGIEVFGGIDLNLSVGGMNPIAVEHMAAITGGIRALCLDGDVRLRKSGALFEAGSAVCANCEGWAVAAGRPRQ